MPYDNTKAFSVILALMLIFKKDCLDISCAFGNTTPDIPNFYYQKNENIAIIAFALCKEVSLTPLHPEIFKMACNSK